MPASDYHDLLLHHLRAMRRTLVDALMTSSPPTQTQLRDLANVQQAIAATESVVGEIDASTGGMPLKKT